MKDRVTKAVSKAMRENFEEVHTGLRNNSNEMFLQEN